MNSIFIELNRRRKALIRYSMVRFAKRFGVAAALLLGWQSAMGFALMGPIGPVTDPWQVPVIGFDLGGDIGGPKNLGEEYRWNTPYIYYAFDQNFLDYFGSNGVFAIEQGIGILNALTNFTSYSRELTEFPLESQRINNRAQALHLIDLKSTAMFLMLEEMGLTEPDRYTWIIRTRDTQPGLSCPFMIYTVTKRNFDPVPWEPTAYVNGNLLSYLIFEFCTGPNPLADAVDFPVDPLATEFTAVMSSSGFGFIGVLRYGAYVTSLSRDDVGGLRYIYRTNNVNWETVTTDSLLFETNRSPQLLFTSNLTLLASQALTNDAVALSNLFPGLIITSTTNSFEAVWVTNIFPIFTNPPWLPANLFQIQLVTNRTLVAQTVFHHTFANLVSIQITNGQFVTVPVTELSSANGRAIVTVQTEVVTNAPWSPAGGLLITNVISRTSLTNTPVGEFFILPTNSCDVRIISSLITNVTVLTNTFVATNDLGLTNFTGQFFVQNTLTFFTNHIFVALLVNCTSNSVGLRQGMDQFTFIRTAFDSLVGRFFQPITNTYQLVGVTNSTPHIETFRRVVTRPDFLFSAQDWQDLPSIAVRSDTSVAFNTNNINFGLAGPGNIDPSLSGRGIEISFSKVGPLLGNLYNTNAFLNGLSESTASTNFIWGSFNGGTNIVIYPEGRSIMDMEAMILFQITSSSLAEGTIGQAYTNQLQVAGGQSPFTWTVASGSLPPGLSLSSAGVLTGTPTTPGTFILPVSVMEAGSRSTSRNLVITIIP